jgi:hypothetical protein
MYLELNQALLKLSNKITYKLSMRERKLEGRGIQKQRPGNSVPRMEFTKDMSNTH